MSLAICAVGGTVPAVALAKPRFVTTHDVRRNPTRCRKRGEHHHRRCKLNRAPKREPKPPGMRHVPQVVHPSAGPPVCQLPILLALPAGAGGPAIVGGILSGGPGGSCESASSPLLDGTILVETDSGSVIVERVVSEHEYFEVPLNPGIYRVSGIRYAPQAIPITCGPATSPTEFAGGETITVVEGQTTYIYCQGDIP